MKTLPANVAGTTVGARHEATDPSCSGPVRQTVWYRFSRSTPGTVLVSFQSAGQLDAVVSVYQLVNGAAPAASLRGVEHEGARALRVRDASGRKTAATFLFLVGQRVNSDAGKFKLAVSAPERPDNDELAGAVPIGQLPATVSGSTVGATRDIGDPSCAGGGGTRLVPLPPRRRRPPRRAPAGGRRPRGDRLRGREGALAAASRHQPPHRRQRNRGVRLRRARPARTTTSWSARDPRRSRARSSSR